MVNMESGVRWPKSVWDGGVALKRMDREREMELVLRFEIISRGLASFPDVMNSFRLHITARLSRSIITLRGKIPINKYAKRSTVQV